MRKRLMGGGTGPREVAAAIAILGSLATPAAGQSSRDLFPPTRAAIAVFTGVLAPLNNLTADPSSFGTSVSSSPLVGADFSFWLSEGSLGIGVTGLFAPADLEVKPSDFQGAVPEELGGADYLAVTASLLYRLRLSGPASAVEPFFSVGGGIRRLSVREIAAPEVEDVTDPVGTVSGGASIRFSKRFAIRFEVRDYLSNFTSPTTDGSRLQNDVAIGIGLSTRLR